MPGQLARGNILVVSDEPTRCWLEKTLAEERFQVWTASGWNHDALKLFELDRVDLIICDLTLDAKNGLHFLRFLKGVTHAPVIMLTAGEGVRRVVRAMDHGAYDFIPKPIERNDLFQTIGRALNLGDLLSAIGKFEQGDHDLPAVARLLIGKSLRMSEIRSEIASLAPKTTNLCLQGESGTGKRLVSRVIHETGATSGHLFVAVDLTSIPHQQLERVLFGEVRGEPGIVVNESRGLFELAGTGTLLLNNISEISQDVQKKLVSVLDNKRFELVGGKEPVPLRARVICTSKKDLGKLVRKGEFDQELYCLITTSIIIIPPLRERIEDIPELVAHFLRKINRNLNKQMNHVPEESMLMLKAREWPGNVRELELTLSRAVAAADCNVLKTEYLMQSHDQSMSKRKTHAKLAAALAERDHIKLVLDSTNWDKKKAALLLKISKQTLYNKIKKYNIV